MRHSALHTSMGSYSVDKTTIQISTRFVLCVIYIATIFSKESAGDEMSKDEKGRCISFTL